jgi:hypothetical protein
MPMSLDVVCRRGELLIVLLLAVVHICSAQDKIDGLPVRATDPFESDLEIAGVRVGQTTLEEVVRLFPGTTIVSRPHEHQVCVEDEQTGTRITFSWNERLTFSPDDVGPRNAITDYTVREKSVEPSETDKCATINFPAIGTKGGLRLGLTLDGVKQLLGTPKKLTASTAVYTDDYAQAMNANEREREKERESETEKRREREKGYQITPPETKSNYYFLFRTSIELEFSNGKLQRFAASRRVLY